jgi:hypothetical protein
MMALAARLGRMKACFVAGLITAVLAMEPVVGAPAIETPRLRDEALDLVGRSDATSSDILAVDLGQVVLHVPRNYIDQFDGFQSKFGYVRIRALLPCLLPQTPENAKEFDINRIGRTVRIRISEHQPRELVGPDWLLNRLNERSRTIAGLKEVGRLPAVEDEILPNGFTLYRAIAKFYKDMFVRHNPSPLFMLECSRFQDVPYPFCSQRELTDDGLLLEYTYDRVMMHESPDVAAQIDTNIRRLVDVLHADHPASGLLTHGVCR